MKICTRCHIEKPITDFYTNVSGCKACCVAASKVVTKCIDCGIERTVTKTSVRNSQGRCGSCAQKLHKNLPEVRKHLSQMARIQVLRQGGVPNARKFTSENMSGENHPRWKGGNGEINAKRSTREYQAWKNAVYERDNHTCVQCKKTEGMMHAHHVASYVTRPDLRYVVSNGRTLCHSCHMKLEQELKRLRKNMVVIGQF